MFVLFEITAIKSFLLGIPESLGVLVFGLGLAAAAILTRRVFARAEAARTVDDLDEKVTR
jgi:hypothetical protein